MSPLPFRPFLISIFATATLMSFAVALGGEKLPDGRPRFVAYGDVVEDRKTSLLWQKDGAQSGRMNFPRAQEYAKSLKLDGVSGWRLPTAVELSTIFPANDEPWLNSDYNPRRVGQGDGPFAYYWAADPPKEKDNEFRSACAFHWWEDGRKEYQHGEKNAQRVRCVRDELQAGETLVVVKRDDHSPKPGPDGRVRDLIGGALGDRPGVSPGAQRFPDVVPERDKFDPKLPVNLRQGLVACWNFDFDDGDVLRDSAGKHHLTRHGGELTLGFRGNAWWHFGLPDPREPKPAPPEFCEIGNYDAFNFAPDSEFTIAGWIFARMNGVILALQNSQTDAEIVVRLAAYQPTITYLEDGQSADRAVRFGSRTLDRQWHHIALLRRRDRLQFYCDGELTADREGRYTGSITTDLRAFGLDRKAPRENRSPQQLAELGWQGGLDEFCVYSRPLNVNEIRKLAAGELSAWVRDTRISPPVAPPAFVLKPQVATTPRLPPSAKAAEPKPETTLSIPARSPECDAKQLDLTDFYNAPLKGTWHPETQVSGARANDLAKLPLGLHKFDGTPFDLRGVIQLQHAQRGYWQGKFSTRVEGIPVNQKFAKIHFLHAAAFTARDGVEIGGYELIYADKTKELLPIVFGEDVRDWWMTRPEPLTGERAKVVWTGDNEAAAAIRASIRLFRSTWPNPHPDLVVEKLNFISLSRDAAPFLIAVSVE